MDENREISDAADQHEDPADVLANMAANQPAGEIAPPEENDRATSDVLTEMADGDKLPSDDDFAAAPAEEADGYDAEIAAATGLAGEDARRARQARSANIGAHQARATRHASKRFMIPMLLALGVLLLVVGLASVLILSRGDSGADAKLTIVMLLSFPLAAVMIFGAYWFHREVKRDP